MTTKSLLHSSLLDNLYYNSMLVGNEAFVPPSDEDILAEEVLTSSQASVTFSNLVSSYGSDYQHLQIRFTARDNRTSYTSSGWYMQFNGDTGSNYTGHILYGNGSSVVSYNDAGWTNASLVIVGHAASANATANAFAGGVVDILDPFETTKYTTSRALTASPNSINLDSQLWNNTNAVDSISIIQGSSNQFVAGSRFTLIGLK